MNVSGWTESRYWNFIRGVLRSGFKRYPNKYKALASSKRGRGEYECNSCKGVFKAKEVSVDHISPCGSIKSYEDVATFAETLFCSPDNLQVLCKECHYNKTMKDRGHSMLDIEVIQFKKHSATKQRIILSNLGVTDVGKNQAERVEQYKQIIELDYGTNNAALL